MSPRHSRQRSSVSVKKRSSFVQDDNDDEIYDNALSTDEKIAPPSSPSRDYFSLGSPYPDKQNQDKGRMESLYDGDTEWTARQNGLQIIPPMDEMTTRTEFNLVESEEDEESRSTSTTSSIPAPAVPPKQVPSTPLKESTQASTSYTMSPVLASIDRMTPSRQNSFSGITSTPKNTTGGKKLSLLAGGSVLNSQLSQSPSRCASPSSSSRINTPIAAQNKGPSTLRKLQPVKRMSLSYVPSPATKSAFFPPGSVSYDSAAAAAAAATTPSAMASPIAYTPSTGSYFGRSTGSNPGTPNLTSSSTFATNSTSPLATRFAKKEDGDTVMAHHRNVLSRIAERERRILDIKEMLAKEEDELRKLQKEWQTSVNRELVGSGSRSIPTNTNESSRQRESRADGNDQSTVNVASEGWKAISARLAGAGTQLNAFIDGLAIPLSEEERQSNNDVGKIRAGLDVLQEEEAEEGDSRQVKQGIITSMPPAVKTLSSQPSVETSTQSKRTSIFSSMAGIQKQVEAQFGAVRGINSTDNTIISRPSNADGGGGWGTWQKRLKEARENATGLLAKAEAKIGQAMDDLVEVKPSPKMNDRIELRPGITSFDFSGENDREKAALAELSWLNSLAGINMSGTTDRVTTSRSPDMQAKKVFQDSTEQDINRRISSSSRASTSQTSTSKTANTTPATTIGPVSPSTSSTSGAEQDSRRDPNGFFPLFGSNSIDQSAPLHKRQSSNGNTKTRMAVKVAMQDRESSGIRKIIERDSNRSSLPPAQDSNADDEAAWGV